MLLKVILLSIFYAQTSQSHHISRLKFKIHKNISRSLKLFDFQETERSMNFLVDEKLNEKQLRRLKEHIYSSCGKSILEQKLNPFWNCVVEKLPLCAGLYIVIRRFLCFIASEIMKLSP